MDKQDFKDLKRAKYGKNTRKPLENLINDAHNTNASINSQHIIYREETMKLIEKATTNQEVIDARNEFRLLHEYLDDIEFRIIFYQDFLDKLIEENKRLLGGV